MEPQLLPPKLVRLSLDALRQFLSLSSRAKDHTTDLQTQLNDASMRFQLWAQNTNAFQVQHDQTSLECLVRGAPKLRELLDTRLSDLKEDLLDCESCATFQSQGLTRSQSELPCLLLLRKMSPRISPRPKKISGSRSMSSRKVQRKYMNLPETYVPTYSSCSKQSTRMYPHSSNFQLWQSKQLLMILTQLRSLQSTILKSLIKKLMRYSSATDSRD